MKDFKRGLGFGIGIALIACPLVCLSQILIYKLTLRASIENSLGTSFLSESGLVFEDSNFENHDQKAYMVTNLVNTGKETYRNITMRCDVVDEEGFPIDNGLVLVGILRAGETKKVFVPIGINYGLFTGDWKYDLYLSSGQPESFGSF